MNTHRHAITRAARHPEFWPSIAVASAQLRRRRLAPVGREQAGDPAVLRLLPPASTTTWTAPGSAR